METDSNYYFYRLGETSAKYTLSIVENQATVCTVDESSPQAIVVGLKNSISFVMTDGFIRVLNPSQDQTAIVDAVSSSGATTKTCTVELQVSSVEPDTIGTAVQVKDPPISVSVESATIVELNLNDYYTGSRLQYMLKNLSSSINYDRQTVENHPITGLDISQSPLIVTQSVTINSYYRVSRK